MKTLVCPKCHQEYADPPAISREDNKTLICPRCGMREALDAIGISEEEKNAIIKTVEDRG